MNLNMGVIEKMVNLFGNDLLKPIVILLAIGVGIVLLVEAILDLNKRMFHSTRGALTIKTSEVVAEFIVAGALLMGGALGGFNFIEFLMNTTANTAVEVAKGEYSGQPPDGFANNNVAWDNPLEDYNNDEIENKANYVTTTVEDYSADIN